ncbi:MAG: hypothetical protein QN187_03570 [Armatimonadota bacterium]|nr:hypothetical protein [Armatimonadota bacterium]MDR7518967.1 hypothetical protein [Armatimonadota bacterium]MDR7548562.1 hypothetical protein [Armatimonadota bacterium]
MEWGKIWRTVFCGWDGDVDWAALTLELARASRGAGDEQDAAVWVCRQIQEAY